MDTRTLTQLRPHPENIKIYGDIDDVELVESITKKGVLTPLLITHDNIIISGHRRWRAAKTAGCKMVPIVVFLSKDPLDILETLIESNRQRQKTNEQIGREANALLDIEKKRAKDRQLAALKQGDKKPVPELVPERKKEQGESRDAVGQKVGVSGKTAKQAAVAVAVMDKLEAAGKTVEAHQVRQQLKKNAGKAYQIAKVLAPLVTPPEEQKPAKPKEQPKYITLDYWQTLKADEQQQLIADASRKSKDGINEQKTDNIEWAKWSWNPVVGCLHNCPYCYARDIAEKTYPQKFAPAFVPSRLHTPRNVSVPSRAATEIGYKNIFACSMADLFGKWVPTEWIAAVLSVVQECPQWNFLFLTKFPLRLAEFSFPDNAWVGTSVDCQARVENAERAFRNVHASVKWLSCEPLLENLTFTDLSMFDWVVIGGATESKSVDNTPATPAFHPPRSWINGLWAQAREAGCKVYEKTNLLDRLREYPGQREEQPVNPAKDFAYSLLQERG